MRANDAATSNDRHVLWGAIIALALGITALAALGRYAFIWKTAVIPILCITALLSRRLGKFIDDWAVFLALVILFDFVRGLIFALITYWQLPVYMQYAIAAERWLSGGEIMPVLVQRWRAVLPWAGAVDRFLTVIHGSHFAFFLLFGFAVWLLRPTYFGRYTFGVIALVYLSALIYLLVPTVPPWMAAGEFAALPPIAHISAHLYNTNLPVLQEAFDINPIAAMPSLHAALPTLCVLMAVEVFGRRALVLTLYLATVYVAIIYLGEHYLVDVLAGAFLAGLVFALARRVASRPRWLPRPLAVRPMLLATFLIIVAEGVGQFTLTLARPFEVTPAFAARELAGRTPLAHFFLGRFAFERGDLASARIELEQAAATIEHPAQRHLAARWLARTAYAQGDHGAVIAGLAPVRDDADIESQILLARAYLDGTESEAGDALLRRLVSRFPREPEPLYWWARYGYQQQRLSAEDVQRVARRLETLEGDDGVQGYSVALLALVP